VNCDSVHRRLFSLERLDRPPTDLRQHLNGCPVCRSLHEQLMLLECEVPQLPVPAPTRKSAFLEELARESPVSSFTPRLFRPAADPRRERGLQKMALAVGLAATLLIAALGVWIWNQDRGPRPQGMDVAGKKSPLQELKAVDPRWQLARTPGERVKLLDEVAVETEGKALALARPDALDELERHLVLYREVIDELTEKEAPRLAPEDRRKALDPIARRMAEVQSEAKRLAMRFPEAAGKLDLLAHLAGEGDRRLRALL
jgi:hypothetical protein